jgi:hypothetical protein
MSELQIPDNVPDRPRREPRPEYQFKPAERWLGERQVMVLLIAISILSLFSALWFSVNAIRESRKQTWVVVLDDSGAYTIAPASLEDSSSALFLEIAMQAAELSLKRNPNGLSYPEFADKMFSDLAVRDLMNHVSATKDDRKRRNLYDSPEIEKVEKLDENSRELAYRVVGVIVRSGALDGQALRETGRFRLFVKLVKQPMLRERGRYPFSVVQWALKIEWNDSSREEWGNGLDRKRS